jgi:hypothetical protein
MARDNAPVGPNENIPPVDPKSGRWTKAGLESHRQVWRQVVAGFVLVPCSASGKNTVTLTPRLHKEGAVSLGNGMSFIYEAEQTSDGNMSITLGTLGTFNLYKANGATRAAAGDHTATRIYRAVYWGSLNASAGGFVIL